MKRTMTWLDTVIGGAWFNFFFTFPPPQRGLWCLISLARIDFEPLTLKNKQFSGTPSHPWVKMCGLYFDDDSGGTGVGRRW